MPPRFIRILGFARLIGNADTETFSPREVEANVAQERDVVVGMSLFKVCPVPYNRLFGRAPTHDGGPRPNVW